jgi:hypothetical protein
MNKQRFSLKLPLIIYSIGISIFLQGCDLVNITDTIVEEKVTNSSQATNRTIIRKAKRRKTSVKASICFVQQEEPIQVIAKEDVPTVVLLRKEESKEIIAKTAKDQGDINRKRRLKEQEEVKSAAKKTFRPAKRKRKCTTDLINAKEEISVIEDVTETDGPAKKKSKRKELGLLDFPAELLEEVISYLSYKEAMLMRQVSHDFYALITGYDQVGMVGVANKPDRRIAQAKWSSIKSLDFDKIGNKLSSMPSFVFYQLLKGVENLPPAYWPYLAETQVHTVDFFFNKIECKGVAQLGQCLQNSKVHTILLWTNQVKAKGAEAFGKTLVANKNVRIISFNDNQLQASGAKGLTAQLPKQVEILHLRNNNIQGDGAIEVAKNIQNTAVEELDLQINKIGDEGAIGLIENIQGTLLKRLYLGGNAITDKGAIEISKKIKNTNLEELSFVGNSITNKGALAIVRGCQNTTIEKLDLSHNKGITDEGIMEIAKEKGLDSLQLREISLRHINLLSLKKDTQLLLRAQYSHIKWIFS